MRATVFCLSAALLAHEVCLLRVLAIAHWSHAASLVVSVALLGFGAAGTLLAASARIVRPTAVAVCAALYAASVPLSLAVAGLVDFNVLEVGWNPSQWGRLFVLQIVFFVPFLFGGLGVAIAMALWRARAGRMYAANLLGSGLGALAAVPLLGWGPPETALTALAVLAALSALFVPGRVARVAGVVAAVFVVLWGTPLLPMSPFKDLAAAPNKTILETSYSEQGRVDRARVPSLHHAPGLSLLAASPLPPQEGLYVDGHLAAAVDGGSSDYLAETVGALPFLLVPDARQVVRLGVGPALARTTLLVEPDADLVRLAGRPGRVAAPRAFLTGTQERFDVLALAIAERDPVHETPMLTVEGLALALDRVTPRGVVCIEVHLATPPRAGLRLLNTAERVTSHVVAVRSVDHLAVALCRAPPSAATWARVEDFCDRLGFDVVRPLDRRPARPHHETATPLVDPGEDYPFDVAPVTDARPYFHRTFRWSRLGDLLDRDAIPFVQWGFVLLVVALGQVLLLGAVVLVLPLLLTRAARAPAPLFLALGLAYMLLEMAFLARATVRLASPTLAAAVVISAFLLGSGAGAWMGERRGRPLVRAALLAALLALPALLLLPSTAGGIALLVLLVAFPMGMPFPAALSRLPGTSVPWALAVNGWASVGAAAAAPLLSSTVSIPFTAGVGAALYLVVGAGYGVARRLRRS